MAEDALDSIRCFLLEQGYPTTKRRIGHLAFSHDEEYYFLQVGALAARRMFS